MHFSMATLLCLAGTTLAAPVPPTTSANIVTSMKNIMQSLNELADSLKAITPRMSSEEVVSRWPRIEKAGHAVADLLSTDARYIRTSPKVTVSDSTALLQPIEQMALITQRTVDQWIAIKPAINARDKKGIVGLLKHHENSANEYADAVVSVQSTLNQPAGKLFGSRVTMQIERAIVAYY